MTDARDRYAVIFPDGTYSRVITHPPGPLTNAAWRAHILARAAAERAEADRMDACADPIRAAIHRHCARVLEEVAEKAKGFAG